MISYLTAGIASVSAIGASSTSMPLSIRLALLVIAGVSAMIGAGVITHTSVIVTIGNGDSHASGAGRIRRRW